MSSIFGITSTSLLNFYWVISRRYGRHRVVLLRDILRQPHFRRRLRRAQIVIAANVNELNVNSKLLSRYRAPIVVFDNPANLQEYQGVQSLDIPLTALPLEFKFRREPVDYLKLFAAVKQRNQIELLPRKSINLLPKIISAYTVSGFMNLFNTFLYSATAAANRAPIRDLMVMYVFAKITEGEFRLQLSHRIKLTAKNQPLLQVMIDYINSSKGQILRAALQHALQLEQQAAVKHASNRRTVKYKELVNTHGVDRFELRNLILLYRNLNNQGTTIKRG